VAEFHRTNVVASVQPILMQGTYLRCLVRAGSVMHDEDHPFETQDCEAEQ